MAPPLQENSCLGVSAICWAIWKVRNRACFDKKLIKNPVEIVCHAGGLMKHWIGLFAGDDRAALEEGFDTMVKIALELLAAKRSRTSEDAGNRRQGDEEDQA